jgi:hypothetical protein
MIKHDLGAGSRGRRGTRELPDQAPRTDAHVLERRPRSGSLLEVIAPAGFETYFAAGNRVRRQELAAKYG